MFSLILVLYAANVYTTHVGNFKSMSDCMSAAMGAQTYMPTKSNIIFHPGFICVQTNDEGSAPPTPSEGGYTPNSPR